MQIDDEIIEKYDEEKIREKLLNIEGEMQDIIAERDEVIRGLLLSLIARKHIFLLGTAGTAKSLMIRMLSETVEDADYWERLFTRYTVPEEVFGAVKLSALEQDKFERNIEGKLPTSNFAFIDEIWKANSSILNSLLTVLNERMYHNNGNPIEVPLETMMSASNELPENRDELGAMWDRFLVKFRVKLVQENKSLKHILKLQDSELNIDESVNLDEIHLAQYKARQIDTNDEIMDNIILIRNQLFNEGIRPSDRRFREAMKVIKAEAWMNDRDEVKLDDLHVLRWILWDEAEHISMVSEIITDITNPYQNEADELYDAIMDAWSKVSKLQQQYKKGELENRSKLYASGSEAIAKIQTSTDELRDIREKLDDENRSTKQISRYIDKAKEIVNKKINKDIMMISD